MRDSTSGGGSKDVKGDQRLINGDLTNVSNVLSLEERTKESSANRASAARRATKDFLDRIVFMLRPSIYFPDYPKPESGLERLRADRPQSAVNNTHPERHAQDFQRIVLPSGCVLFRLGPASRNLKEARVQGPRMP